MSHAFQFVRIGGVDQVVIRDGSDLLALKQLDPKLWVALTCPTVGVEMDSATLSAIDRDGDGRIHVDELLAAIAWAAGRLRSADALMAGHDGLGVADIADPLLQRTAAGMLTWIDAGGGKQLTVAQATAAAAAFAARAHNGDGIVHSGSVSDPATAKLCDDIVACSDAPTDRSGAKGVSADTLAAFFGAIADHLAWLKGEGEAQRPLGAATGGAHAAFTAVRAKVDDYFARCRVAAYDPRSVAAINRDGGEYAGLTDGALDPDASAMRHFPLAQVAAGRALPLGEGVNPAWTQAVTALRDAVVVPLLGARDELSPAEWAKVVSAFAARDAWLAAKAGASVEGLGADRVAAIAAGDGQAAISAAIAADAALSDDAASIDDVVRLARLHRDLITLVHNFVSFRDFYDRSRKAIFQAGTLYFDHRSCELVLPVLDGGRHAAMASKSNAFLAYCDCKAPDGRSQSIVAAVTGGDVDHIAVGRNGLFYDRKGTPWAATVTRIVDQPISIRQAFWSPYKKMLRFIEDQVDKRAADAEAKADADRVAALEKAKGTVDAGKAPEAPKEKAKIDIGMLAAIGVAVGGLAAAAGAIFNALFGLGVWMPLGVLALLLAISLPSMAVAWLKLRKRNLGPLLDANGWAINAMAKVNVGLGESLTPLASLPAGSSRDLRDPFAQRGSGAWIWPLVAIFLVVAGLWAAGKLDAMLPESVRLSTVMPSEAPPAAEPAPAAAPAPAPAPAAKP